MKYSALSLLPALAAASPMMQVGTIHKDAAPILSSTQSKEVPNQYMVVFKKHVKESHAKEHHNWVQSIHTKSNNERMELRKRSQFPVTTEIFDGLKHTYNIIGGMVGYSGHFDDETIEAIRRHPDVSSTHFARLPSVPSWKAIRSGAGRSPALAVAQRLVPELNAATLHGCIELVPSDLGRAAT